MKIRHTLFGRINFVTIGIALLLIWRITDVVRFQISRGGMPCVMDCITNMVWTKCSAILYILVALEYVYREQKEYNVMQLVRMKSRGSIWLEKCGKTEVYCLAWSLLFMGTAFITGIICTDGLWMNWNDAESIYQLRVARETVSSHPPEIMMTAFFIIFLQMNVALHLLLIYWLSNSFLCAVMPVLAIVMNDIHEEWVPVLFRRFTVRGLMWGNFSMQWI